MIACGLSNIAHHRYYVTRSETEMKNYKINSTQNNLSIFGCKTFTGSQIQELKERGFIYNDFPLKQWHKTYSYNPPFGVIEMRLSPGDEYMRFYANGYILPCELKVFTNQYYKKLMKVMSQDIKFLKKIGVIK